jgi:glucarate dehydratase
MRYENGTISVPTGAGLGVKLNREKVRQYAELYERLGGYPYDQDPARPGWTPLIPNDRWADPDDARSVAIPY